MWKAVWQIEKTHIERVATVKETRMYNSKWNDIRWNSQQTYGEKTEHKHIQTRTHTHKHSSDEENFLLTNNSLGWGWESHREKEREKGHIERIAETAREWQPTGSNSYEIEFSQTLRHVKIQQKFPYLI